MPCPLGDMSQLSLPRAAALVAAAAGAASKGIVFVAASMKQIAFNKPATSAACAIALVVTSAVAWKRHASKAKNTAAMRDELRDFLLGDNGDDIASLSAIEQAGAIFFGSPICLYGLSPRQFEGAGVRLCNRTVIECTNDRLALHTSLCVRSALLALDVERAIVVDIMCGSGNLMMHLMKMLLSPLCLGFENNRAVADCARASLAAVLHSTAFHSRCHVISGDWVEQLPAQWQQRLAAAACSQHDAVVFMVAPPWGDGFCFERGLDLARTHPPVDRVLQQLMAVMAAADGCGRQMFACVQTHEVMVEVRVRCAAPIHIVSGNVAVVLSRVRIHVDCAFTVASVLH